MTATTEPFVHLRVHSAYSLLEGALTIQKLAALARADSAAGARAHRHQQSVRRARILRGAGRGGHPADHRLHAVAQLRRRAASRRRPASCSRPRADGRIALLAKDEAGYANLMRLSTEAYLAASETGEVVAAIADLARAGRRPDRAHRRPGRADRPALAEAMPSSPRARSKRCRRSSATGSMSSSSAMGCRRSGRSSRAARSRL